MSSQTSLTLTMPEAGQLAKTFQGMGDKIPPRLRKATGQTRSILASALSEYPAERDGQTYQRTEELKRGWQTANAAGGGTRFELTNPSEHAHWTQSEEQAWMHVGRWTPVSAIVQELEPEIIALYDETVQEVIS